MGKMTSYWAEIPSNLQQPHEVMEAYAAWAWAPAKSQRCGSAEGMYMPAGGQALEDRRTPATYMTNEQAQYVRNALIKVDDFHRRHLTLLYVQDRHAVRVLRESRVPQALSHIRQIEGLRQFWIAYQAIEREVLDKKGRWRGTLAHHC